MDDSEDDDPDADEESTDQDVEKVRDTLPDVAVPIGLLANLSLNKDKDKGKGRGRGGSATADGSDDNVVSMDFFRVALDVYDGDYSQGVANKEYFLPGNVHRAMYTWFFMI
jgi:hypothetical protein